MIEIAGHQKNINFLQRAIEKGTHSQSYIFSGPQGVGKLTVAKYFAEALILGKNFPQIQAKDWEKVLPDVVLVYPETEEKKGIIKTKEISIDQIREGQKELANFPYSGKFKVLIIDEADRMNTKAQNALLKSIEEPNSSSIIILVTGRVSKILPTVQSRCQIINFGLVGEKDLTKYFDQKNKKIDPGMLNFSMGRPGLILEMIDNPEKIKWFREAEARLNKAGSGKINEKLKLAEEMAKNTPEAIQYLEYWLWNIHSKSDSNQLKWAEQIDKSLDVIRNTNANVRLVLENLFLK